MAGRSSRGPVCPADPNAQPDAHTPDPDTQTPNSDAQSFTQTPTTENHHRSNHKKLARLHNAHKRLYTIAPSTRALPPQRPDAERKSIVLAIWTFRRQCSSKGPLPPKPFR